MGRWGTFRPPPFLSGVTLAIWYGGGYDRLAAALGGSASAWVTAEGGWYGYIPGPPVFVNAPFLERLPDGIPAGAAAGVAR
jgi:hypothetical protein